MRGIEQFLQTVRVAAVARSFARSVVDKIAFRIQHRDGRNRTSIVAGHQSLLFGRDAVQIDHDKINLVAILRIEFNQPLRFARGVPAVRCSKEDNRGFPFHRARDQI